MESFRERNLNFSEFNFGHDRSWNNFIELRQMIREQDYSKWNRPHAWTFTFKFEQSHQSAKRKMRLFLNVINKKVYGNASQRFNKKVKCIPILEGGNGTQFHYHLILEHISKGKMRPETYHYFMDKFWKFGAVKCNGLFLNDDDSETGWVNYITKSETKEKGSEDLFIDVENMTL